PGLQERRPRGPAPGLHGLHPQLLEDHRSGDGKDPGQFSRLGQHRRGGRADDPGQRPGRDETGGARAADGRRLRPEHRDDGGPVVTTSSTGRRRAAAPEVPGMPGVDPRISRTLEVRDHAGERRRWHLLDSGPWLAERGITPRGTLLAVHGNPTFSFLYRTLVREDIPWRLIAVDQLEMGWSERTGTTRRLQDRITDLSLLTDALSIRGPVVTVGHDWGGIVSVGWALDNRHDLAGVILSNTGIHQEIGESLPRALQLATTPAVLPATTSLTDAFIRTTLSLSSPGRPPCMWPPPRPCCPRPPLWPTPSSARPCGWRAPPCPGTSSRPTSPRTAAATAARASRTASPTSPPAPTIPPEPPSSASPRASASCACPLCSPGGRATSPSPTGTCGTCSSGSRTPMCTAMRTPPTWCGRTLMSPGPSPSGS